MVSILIVDDSDVECTLVRSIIAKNFPDSVISIAHNGQEAFNLLAKSPADIILSDIMMPVMDGLEFCRKVKNIPSLKDVPVLLVSSLYQLHEKNEGFEAGASDYIVKPIETDEVVARVKVHLSIKQNHDELKKLNKDLKAAQEALIQSEKMSAVGSLAAGISHEFNNILGMLKGYVQLSQQKSRIEEVKSFLSVMVELIDRGEFLVRSMMDFSKGSVSENKQKVMLPVLIKKVLVLMEQMLRSKCIEIEFSDQTVLEIECYPNQLSQAFINFIKNAMEACEESSIKKIKIEYGKFIIGTDGKESAYIRFIDTGSGIPEAIRNRIFDPFVTTKGVISGGDKSKSGTGLGLTITYDIIKKHNGDVKVEKTGPDGTTMLVCLPL
ncbi:MAG: hybrid sensor histidine kinase/response regulator [Candidatus Omnitrophica bacterium]|nr:hybrid sensor histidine kinase/response regulator [Candidatus Omnitrophota bacterium]